MNVDLDPTPFTEWITACGLEGASFTTASPSSSRRVTVDDVRPLAVQGLADVFSLDFERSPPTRARHLAEPIHGSLARA